MKYFFIAGEASGDLHASNVIRELILLDDDAQIEAWGGDLMANAGATLHKHIGDLAFMGFVEVLANLPQILKNFNSCKTQIKTFQPDVVVLVDYPGFNLRMATWAKKAGFKVLYYISPTVWAWKENRIEIIRRSVDRMICILPFEKAFYAERGIEVDFFGHPTVEVIDKERQKSNDESPGKTLALLPGSRKQEIKNMLPLMLEAVKDFHDVELVIAQAPNLEDGIYEPYIQGLPIRLEKGKTYEILAHAKAALVTSGTATLETALFEVPQVVCYKANALSYWIARMLVKVKFISLVNLIMNREVVREILQNELTVEHLKNEAQRLLYDATYRDRLKSSYGELKKLLGTQVVSLQVAQQLYQLASKK
ncbi:MAG: lipid-A-disaccharide synthase [Chitinophagaceae bacterium]|nr:lipid-A-disaccharide synthase [Chitinophagaceae bacterium]